ncbi:MAG TPA: LLM class F420-dependent oxidoreductase [Acidimicrobiia bacterium]|nr:LLM class F420-dependent oxidoreductase [Acidimicrobiia bacterium]
MKLALRLDLYRAADLAVPMDLVRAAEDLGYHSVWTAEAYGADALSPLAYIAALTTRIKLGTAVVQLAARPPATVAMHAMTIDALAGGNRMILGIGVSGPQIVEGWYGQPWGKPNARVRDYVTIARKVLDREEPVTHDGSEISLPYRGPGALGQGKALKSIMHPVARVPIWLASGGPRNTELCAELCDGWLPMGLPPDGVDGYREPLARGFAKRTDGRGPDDFEIFSGCQVKITDDVRAVLDAMRPLTAMYVGGMGSATHNYHREAMARRGFPEEAARIQELWLAGRKEEAMAAVPEAYLEQNTLAGSPARIRQRWEEEFAGKPGVTGVIVGTDDLDGLELLADLAGTRDHVGA